MAPMNTQAFCHVVAQSIPLLLDFPTRRFSVDYDGDADVLVRPQKVKQDILLILHLAMA